MVSIIYHPTKKRQPACPITHRDCESVVAAFAYLLIAFVKSGPYVVGGPSLVGTVLFSFETYG